jgi:hypothetical protein
VALLLRVLHHFIGCRSTLEGVTALWRVLQRFKESYSSCEGDTSLAGEGITALLGVWYTIQGFTSLLRAPHHVRGGDMAFKSVLSLFRVWRHF